MVTMCLKDLMILLARNGSLCLQLCESSDGEALLKSIFEKPLTDRGPFRVVVINRDCVSLFYSGFGHLLNSAMISIEILSIAGQKRGVDEPVMGFVVYFLEEKEGKQPVLRFVNFANT